MFKDRWIAPTEGQLKYLKGIANGKLTWHVNERDIFELYGETHENGDPKALAKMLADEHIQELRNSRAFNSGFIEIDDLEEIFPGEWCVAVFATAHLEQIISVLSRGVWWSNQNAAPDYEKTEAEWRAYLNRNLVTDAVFMAASKNTDPELRRIRADLVMFKLTADRQGESWRNRHAS